MTDKGVAWVDWISEAEATGAVAEAYAGVADSDGSVENLYKAMSLTPGVIKPADDHYLALLHNPDCPLDPWLAELIATYVAILCSSDYAAKHHGENFHRYFEDRTRSMRILNALTTDDEILPPLSGGAATALTFTRKLSLSPQDMNHKDIDALRAAGHNDVAISYIAQIAASFAYWSRITNALGIVLEDAIGLTGCSA